MSTMVGAWYAHAVHWRKSESGQRQIGNDLEVIRAATLADALGETHNLLERYQRFTGPLSEVEVGIGFGDRVGPPPDDAPLDEMLSFRNYHPTAPAIADAQRLGLRGNVAFQIKYMARHAPAIDQPDPRYRRRWYEYAFWIEGDQVLGVALVQPYNDARSRRRRPKSPGRAR
jgi:hypothetical protein